MDFNHLPLSLPTALLSTEALAGIGAGIGCSIILIAVVVILPLCYYAVQGELIIYAPTTIIIEFSLFIDRLCTSCHFQQTH